MRPSTNATVALTASVAVVCTGFALGIGPASAATPDVTPSPSSTTRGDVTGSPRTLTDRQLRASVVQLSDIPRRYRAVASQAPIASAAPDGPELCLRTSRSTAPKTRSWALSAYTSRLGLRGNDGAVLSSQAWQFPASWASNPARIRTLLATAAHCNGSAVSRDGRDTQRIRVVSKAKGSATVVQNIHLRQVAGPREPVESQVVFVASGRFLVRVTIDRFGDATTAKSVTSQISDKAAPRFANRVLSRLQAAGHSPRSETVPVSTTAAVPSGVEDSGLPKVNPRDAVLPWVVSVGDSYISGEAGRWGGNASMTASLPVVDQLGPTAYYDEPGDTGEVIERCHRSKSAEIHIAEGVSSLNLACSGATANSAKEDGVWKPGIDFATEPGGTRRGQAAMLEEFAGQNSVKMVALSIGGNDFNFSDIIKNCVVSFLGSPQIYKSFCHESPGTYNYVNAARVEAVSNLIAQSIRNVQTAMTNAGYTSDQWKLVVQNYPSPLPRGDGFRYWQTMLRYTQGGCALWNDDATWANDVVLPRVNTAVRQGITRSGATNVLSMDLSKTLNSHRLCENGTSNFTFPHTKAERLDEGEWVQQISTATAAYSDVFMQESFHPNYFGQTGIRSCLRQVYANEQGGVCERIDNGMSDLGEPNMRLRR